MRFIKSSPVLVLGGPAHLTYHCTDWLLHFACNDSLEQVSLVAIGRPFQGCSFGVLEARRRILVLLQQTHPLCFGTWDGSSLVDPTPCRQPRCDFFARLHSVAQDPVSPILDSRGSNIPGQTNLRRAIADGFPCRRRLVVLLTITQPVIEPNRLHQRTHSLGLQVWWPCFLMFCYWYCWCTNTTTYL